MRRYVKELQMHVTFFTKSIEILKKFLIDKLNGFNLKSRRPKEVPQKC
ncbi:conserved hypothetical protein [delta proteobacterium NaphS2]|nr:conserved hypothetical protein [delta proteobacterium NaphS2]